jgi:hypothetical protein
MHIATCLSHEAEKSYDKGEIYLRIYLRVQWGSALQHWCIFQ